MGQVSNHREALPTSMDKPLVTVVIKKRERRVTATYPQRWSGRLINKSSVQRHSLLMELIY